MEKRRDVMRSSSDLDEDETLLTLHRTFRQFDNWAASFAALYAVGGVRVTFTTGIAAGGPLAYWTTYIITTVLTLVTAASLAEICSALPAAGSIYFWAAECGGAKYGRLFGFIVAWWSSTAWTTFVASNCQAASNYMLSEIAIFGLDYPSSDDSVKFRAVVWICSECFLATAILLNWLPPKLYKVVFRITVGIILVDFFLNIIWLPIGVAETYGFKSGHDAMMTTFYDLGPGVPNGWVWCLSFLATGGILVGFDASGHVAEETVASSLTSARGVFWSAASSAAIGFPVVILFLFSTPKLDTLFSLNAPQPFVQLYALALGQHAHIAMNVINILGLVLNSTVAVVAASRLIFAIARDGVLPFSSWIAKVDSHGQPRRAVIVIWVVAGLIQLTILPSSVAFTSLVSAAALPSFTAYALISFGRLFLTPHKFRDPKWSLGFLSKPFQVIAVIWNLFVAGVLISPYQWPVTGPNFNYAGVILGSITILAVASFVIFPADKWRPPVLNDEIAPSSEDYKREPKDVGREVTSS